MSDSRWQQVRQLFEQALELPLPERSLFLEASCGGDLDLKREVEDLLAADTDTTHADRLEAGATAFLQTAGRLVGQEVGDYRVRGILGTGGMGAVYLAEQEEPHRTVALKMLNSGLFSDAARRRFRYEADTLARLSHPGIAQIYEIGTWETAGQVVPFFAMEHVRDASRLDQWARGKSRRAILEQFLGICDAVHYAHQRGVIHRDLKPSNILVDGQSFAKIIDFGIARSTGEHAAQVGHETKAGQILGTLSYMAPEQLEVDAVGDGIDIRVDVHALGVILFELLTGRPPIDVRDTPLSEAARRITEEEIPRPSLFAKVPAELDWIVMKAAAKERDHRYAAVAGLALDLQRFLRNEPVSAGPPSASYRARKFVQRNRVWVAAGAFAIVALVAGTVMATIGLIESRDSERRARRAQHAAEQAQQDAESAQRDAEEAQREAEQAQHKTQLELHTQAAVTSWLRDMLGAPKTRRQGRHVRLIDVLDGSAGRLRALRQAKPEVAALLHHVVALSYQSVGDMDKAEELFEQALDLASVHLGEDHEMTQGVRNNLAVLYNSNGKLAQAKRLHEKVLAWRKKKYGEDHEQTAQSQNNLAAVLLAMQRPKEALALLDVARETLLRDLGPTDRLTMINQNSRGNALTKLGRLPEAEKILRETLNYSEAHFGADHETTMTARGSLAQVLMMRGSLADSAKIWRELVKIEEHRRGPKHARTLDAVSNLGVVLMRQGKYDEAEPFVRRTLASKRGVRYLVGLNSLGVIQSQQGKFDEAQETFALLFESSKEQLLAGHWLVGQFHVSRGDALFLAKDHVGAEKALRHGLDLLETGLGVAHVRTQQALRSMTKLYEAWGKEDDAARYRARLVKKD